MPPKVKKPSNPIIQPQPLSVGPSKIPSNRPLYRRAIITKPDQLKYLKVKLWKLHSLHIQDLKPSRGTRERFGSGTLRSSLSPVKSLKLLNWKTCAENDSFWRLRLKVESLEILNVPITKSRMEKMVKVTHHGLKKMIFEPGDLDSSYGDSHILVRRCRRLESLNYSSKNLRSLMKKRVQLPCLKKVSLKEGMKKSGGMTLFRHCANVQEITLDFKPTTSFQLPVRTLESLQRLVLILHQRPENIVTLDFSLFKVCRNLTCLGLSLANIKPLGLDELLHHLPLQEFSFRQDDNLPIKLNPQEDCLNILQKLCLSSELLDYLGSDGFNSEHFTSLFSTAKNIRALELSFSLRRLANLLASKHNFTLESLKMKISRDFLYEIASQTIGNFLKKQTQIKELDLYIERNKDLLERILKAVYGRTPLEKLRVGLGDPNAWKGSSVREFLERFVGLKELRFDMERVSWDSRDLTGIVEVLMKLKDLERFELSVKFGRITKFAFGKFTEFLKAARGYLKKLVIKVEDGLSEEQMRELEQVVGLRGFPQE